MKHLRYLFACFPSVLCLIGNISGDWTASLNIIFSMLLLPLLEWFLPEQTETIEAPDSNFIPNSILLLLSILHVSVTLSLFYGIYIHQLKGIYIVVAAVSSGVNAGTNGIVVAHELIHRKSALWRALGIFNLLQVNYAHFYIEHIKGHHKYVGTEDDPATARYGESLYRFIRRTIPGQFFSSFYTEQRRLYQVSKSQFLNFVLLVTLLELLIILIVYLFIGWDAFGGYLIYSAVAIFLLEYVNYIEHYGLWKDATKRFEAHHAWQSNKITSRLGLIELSRHADHHMKASKPYHTLDAHPGYILPSGYFGMFYIALLPPLWFKIINPIIKQNKRSH